MYGHLKLCFQLGFPAKRVNRSLEKNGKIFDFFREILLYSVMRKMRIFGGKMRKFHEKTNAKILREKNCGKENNLLWSIKLLMMRSERREFHKHFAKILLAKFCIGFVFIYLIHFHEKMRNFAKKFAKWERTFSQSFCESFRSLETLLTVLLSATTTEYEKRLNILRFIRLRRIPR